MTTTPSDVTINGSIHSYLALTYANYLIVPRTLAQSMPAEWQERMVACLEELREAFAHVEQAEAYDVRPAVESTYDELTPTQRRQLDISYAAGSTDAAPLYFNAYDITTHFGHDRVLAWADRDPVPHYNRGRTFVEPRLPEPAQPDPFAAGKLAARFHEIYERLAPDYGYTTRKASAVPWAQVPEQNRRLMIAVCAEILAEGASS